MGFFLFFFLELSCFIDDPADVGNLISGSSAFSKTSLNIRKLMVHVLLKAGLENFEHYFTSLWDECNCAVVWAFFSIAFLWDWSENWPFLVLWPLLSFPNLLADILECEVKWTLKSITRNKASGGDGVPVELFQILKETYRSTLFNCATSCHL